MTLDEILMEVLMAASPDTYDRLSDPSRWTKDKRDEQFDLLLTSVKDSVPEAMALLKRLMEEKYDERPTLEWIMDKFVMLSLLELLSSLRGMMDHGEEMPAFDDEWINSKIRSVFVALKHADDIAEHAIKNSGIEEIQGWQDD